MKADYVHKDSLTSNDSELSFNMSDEEIKKLMNLLTQGGLRHFVLKLDDEELDVVEYKEYKKLEERIAYLERSIERKDDTILELELERVPYTNEYVEKVEKENEDLKRQLEYCYCNRTDCSSRIKDSKKYDSIQKENEDLKRQLDYLRSGEYYNQLRFENEMLQDVVDNGEVSKKDRAFIYCIHKNTELLEQQQEFIKYLKSINSFETVGNILNKYKEIIGGNKDE